MRWIWLFVASFAVPTAAWAGDNSVFAAGGAVAGLAVHDGSNGALIGGELSGGWLHDSPETDTRGPVMFWVGAYADALYDTGVDTGRVSFGPELGYIFVGLDGGAVHELGGERRWGLAARVSVSVPVTMSSDWLTVLSPYVRGVSWRDDPGHVELGLLFKIVVGK